MLKPPETFVAARLQLRPPTVADATAVFEGYAQNPEVTRSLIWRPHQELATTRAFLRCCAQNWRSAAAFPWVITRREDQALLGMIELQCVDPAIYSTSRCSTWWPQNRPRDNRPAPTMQDSAELLKGIAPGTTRE